jgi:chlorophyll synthase
VPLLERVLAEAPVGVPRRGSLEWARAFWRSLRPQFWLVTVFPLYTGWVLATRELWPGAALWLGFWGAAMGGGATPGEFAGTLLAWLRLAWPLVAGMLCLGPLIWGSTLLYNNYWDWHADRRNPRRAGSPHVQGLITPRQALWGSRGLAALGLLVAATAGAAFLAAMALCLLLSWAYSAPPMRLKGRAGFDVAVNVVGIGVLCTLAGWQLGAPLGAFPWPFLLQPMLLLASAYIPTTLIDYPYDLEAGYRTFAVALGPRRAFLVGFAFAVASNLVFLGAALLDYVVPWRLYQFLWPASVVELAAYWFWLPRWDDLRVFARGLVVAVVSFGLGMGVFLLHYTGWLRV